MIRCPIACRLDGVARSAPRHMRGRPMSGMRTRHRAASATAATTLITLMLALAGCGPLAAGVASPTVGPSLLSPGAAGPLIGAWVSEVTREDLRAGGLSAEGLLDENS